MITNFFDQLAEDNKKEVLATIDLTLSLVKLARKEGVLAVEDYLEFKFDTDDSTLFRKLGLSYMPATIQLIKDGCIDFCAGIDPEAIESICNAKLGVLHHMHATSTPELAGTSFKHLDELRMVTPIASESVFMIMRGVNPVEVSTRLAAYLGLTKNELVERLTALQNA